MSGVQPHRGDPATGWDNQEEANLQITSDDPSPRGKKEVELAAAQFQANKDKATLKKRADYGNMTLRKAIDTYIESRESLNRSPTTIQDYRCIQKNAFQDLMEIPIKDLDEVILQNAINAEARRPSSNWKSSNKKPISAKRLKNEWGLVSAALHKYNKKIDFSEIELPEIAKRMVELPSASDVLRVVKGTEIELSASVMALLRIPDKYAQERGGWKSDDVMKKVYMQTFSEERERVDDLIDSYFEDAMQHEMQHAK